MLLMVKHCCGVCLVLLLLACGGNSKTSFDDQGASLRTFAWRLPVGMPLPVVPQNNPMTAAKFELGRHLFYDRRLSGNGKQACASCHQQDKAFSEDLPQSKGSTAELHPRNAQALVNVAYNSTLTWANPVLLSIEQQMDIPLFGESPVEQGITDELRTEVLQRIIDESAYQALFAAAYPDEGNPYNYPNIIKAIATFVRGLTSFDAAFDRYSRGDKTAMSAAALRGQALFNGEELECFHCHGGYNFSDATLDRTMAFVEKPFHNTGLFNIAGNGDFPKDNQGVFEITFKPADMGKFRAPTLRNIALTAPYMHDGSMRTLSEVIDFYAAGGRNITSGSQAGDGRLSPFKDGFISGFSLTPSQKQDLLAFLNSLTDQGFVTERRFSNPWLEASSNE